MLPGMPPSSRVIAGQSARFVLRERTVAVLGVLFVLLVLVSAWLGWSATSTVNNIYKDAAAFLTASGQPVPPNPVRYISPLSLMRNMSVYVALIGALAAIVIGNRLIATDRKAGVIPLIGTRPVTRAAIATGKIGALLMIIAGLTGIAALVGVLTFAVLPNVQVTALQWAQLAGFFLVSALYMLLFGLMAMLAAVSSRSESVGLLVPVTIWLTLTFIFPQLISNLNPTAAINPIAALAAPPDTGLFHWTGALLGPLSFADSYTFASARLLDFLPEGRGAAGVVPPVADLVLATSVMAGLTYRAVAHMRMTDGGLDV